MSYTKGPLKIEDAAYSALGDRLVQITDAYGEEVLAALHYSTKPEFSEHRTRQLANARLFAAAPELLEALKALTKGLPCLDGMGVDDVSDSDVCGQTYTCSNCNRRAVANLIVAKAEGSAE